MSLLIEKQFEAPTRLPVEMLPFSVSESLPRLYEHATGPFLLSGFSKIKRQIAWHSIFRTVHPHTTRFRMLRALADNDLVEVSRVLQEWSKLKYDVNQPLDGKYQLNALQFSALSNRHAALELLLLNGAAIDHPDRHGCTALMYAAANRNLEAVHTLVKNGCSITSADKYGYTAVDRAETRGFFSIEDYLRREASKPRKRIFPVFTVQMKLEQLLKNDSMQFTAEKKEFTCRALLSPFNNLKGLYNITFTNYTTVGDRGQSHQP